jgi:hypothetical protein
VSNRPSLAFRVARASRLARPGKGVAEEPLRWLALAWLLMACLLSCPWSVHGADEWEYTIASGENLWVVTDRYLKSRSYLGPLQKLNGIRDPRRIPPGTRIRIPSEWLRQDPATAQIVAIDGQVQVRAGLDGVARDAVPAQTLTAGDALETGSNGSVTIQFPDRSRVTLPPESLLLIEALRAYAIGALEVQMRLPRGRTESVVPARRPPTTRYLIKTPAGITSVRGTDFRVSMTPQDAAMRTEVLRGRVGVSNAGRDVDVPEAFGTVAQVGQPPSDPIRLLPAPELGRIPASIAEVPAELTFPAVPGAQAYRTQIAAGPEFAPIVADSLTTLPAVQVPALPLARYVLRVRAVDRNGLEGMVAEQPLEVKPRPAAPVLLDPPERAELPIEGAALTWRPTGQRVTYRLQVARDPTFSHPVVDLAGLAETSYSVRSDLDPGLYYWRVAASDPELGDGSFGPPRSFRRPPPTPTLDPVVVGADRISVRWQSALPSPGYRVQIARDRLFQDVWIDTAVDRPSLEQPRPAPGAYFVRVCAVGADGYEGPFAAAHQVDLAPPPSAPSALRPEDGARVVTGTQVEFGWTPSSGAAVYRLQLGADADFAAPLVDSPALQEPRFQLPDALRPGIYYWRIAAATTMDGQGAFSNPTLLRVLPRAPDAPSVALSRDLLVISWAGQPSVEGYRVQLAREPAFGQMVLDRLEHDRTLSTGRPASGTYFVRVQAVGPDGVAGPFSPTRSVEVRSRFSFWPLLLLLPFLVPW